MGDWIRLDLVELQEGQGWDSSGNELLSPQNKRVSPATRRTCAETNNGGYDTVHITGATEASAHQMQQRQQQLTQLHTTPSGSNHKGEGKNSKNTTTITPPPQTAKAATTATTATAERRLSFVHTHQLKIVQRHDGVDEPHLQRLVRRVVPTQEPDLPRLLLPNDPRHVRRPVPGIKTVKFKSTFIAHGSFNVKINKHTENTIIIRQVDPVVGQGALVGTGYPTNRATLQHGRRE